MATTAQQSRIAVPLSANEGARTLGGSTRVNSVGSAQTISRTEASSSHVISVVSTPPRPAQEEQPEPRDAGLAHRVQGVVTRVDGASVAISIQLPAGSEEISVAAEIVPEALSQYGNPVWISLDATGGYKRLAVTERRLDGPRASSRVTELEKRLAALE